MLQLANSMDTFITDLVGQLQESKSNLREVQERLCQRDKECETLAKVCKNVVKMEDDVEHLKQDASLAKVITHLVITSIINCPWGWIRWSPEKNTR